MNNSLLQGAAAMRSLEKRFEAITMNLANADTPGFKRLLHVERAVVANAAANSSDEVKFPQVNVSRDTTQGALVPNGDPHELALNGDGFFVAEDSNGLKLTRRAHFSINDSGEMILGDGSKLMGTAGPLVVPQGSKQILVDDRGQVRADGTPIGRVRLVDADLRQRNSEGNGFVRVAKDEQLNPSDALVQQGVRERSNVEPVDELLQLMVTNRLYEANTRSMTARDRVSQRLIQQLQ